MESIDVLIENELSNRLITLEFVGSDTAANCLPTLSVVVGPFVSGFLAADLPHFLFRSCEGHCWWDSYG